MLGLPISGSRPDFIGISPIGAFSLEAKGRKTPNATLGLLADAKAQTTQGLLPVAFGYASVTVDLYGVPQCFFHDPIQEGTPIDRATFQALITGYYRALLDDLTANAGVAVVNRPEADYYAYSVGTAWGNASILLNRDVEARMNGGGDVTEGYETINEHAVYVDRDGIGISFDG